jgi:hypothetical protein
MDDMQTQEAAKLWREGEKAADIGAKFGFSKQKMTAFAAARRELFPARTTESTRASGFTADQIEARVEATDSVKVKWPPKATNYDGVPRGQLTRCGCEFPLWGDHERYVHEVSLYCGAPKAGGRPYCGFHCNVAKGYGTPSERAAASVLAKAA